MDDGLPHVDAQHMDAQPPISGASISTHGWSAHKCMHTCRCTRKRFPAPPLLCSFSFFPFWASLFEPRAMNDACPKPSILPQPLRDQPPEPRKKNHAPFTPSSTSTSARNLDETELH
eukprot:3594490-Rhodomonas_salina.5